MGRADLPSGTDRQIIGEQIVKLGVFLGNPGAEVNLPVDYVQEAERLGYDSVWTSEAYGADAVSTAAWLLAQTTKIKVGTAIMQMPARSPTTAAMTAMTLDALSGGRFILGIGASGPQVVEGWYGVRFGKPLLRTREYIQVIRKILERKEPLAFQGEEYTIPYNGSDATGLGKPLKSIVHGDPALKIYTATITPASIRNSAEVADGMFPMYMNPDRFDLFEADLNTGFAKAGGDKSLKNYDLCPIVSVSMNDDLEMARAPVKQIMALYIGGMGAREKNFYNDYAKRLGYEEEAVKIQDAYLDGRKEEAAALVPDALVDELALVGSAARIRNRLQAWKEAGKRGEVHALLLRGNADVAALRVIAEEVL